MELKGGGNEMVKNRKSQKVFSVEHASREKGEAGGAVSNVGKKGIPRKVSRRNHHRH